MAYELFVNVPSALDRDRIDQALEQLQTAPELEDVEIHELEEIGRSPEEYVEDLEWLMDVDGSYQRRYREFCERHGLDPARKPPDPTAATRFMEALGGFDLAVVRLPGPDELEDEDTGDRGGEAARPAVARAYRALVEVCKRNGYRLMDPQYNDPGEFIDLDNPGELPPAYG